ncbi:hypothetical protein [Algoriphagus limi]|uniref:Uncharacterized protein n=1 Tax=Algoriphagus limi TaxID=2975273 RepID=A0ABT2G6Z0_9BACT|nr:hypothetical protein [Algoriphagus limi]MCS5490538.1 hypothetical protein [Algoriphagus limi]
MKIRVLQFSLLFFSVFGLFSSCACNPEDLIKVAFTGIEAIIGDGFIPSDEIRALGEFENMQVNLTNTPTEKIIILRLENGDPKKLSNQPEILARKCAEIYLRDFDNAQEYDQIIIQFVQTDPYQPENYAIQEHEFQVSDFF